MDYYTMRDGITSVVGNFPHANATQRKAKAEILQGANFMTPDIWGVLSLDNGAYVVEVSSGHFIDKYIYGVTVLVRGEDGRYQKADHDSGLNRCLQSLSEVQDYLAYLNDPEAE